MVADPDPDVKAPDKRKGGRPSLNERFLAFIDNHPRCGWYIMAILLLNTLLNLLDLFH
jgi:hypothetical protein